MNKKSIALIDPVGGKAGMDFYDISLMKSMASLGYSATLFSNFDISAEGVHTVKSFNNIGVPKVMAIFNNFVYFISALIFCKRKKVAWLFLHLFRGGLFDLVTIGLARLLGIRIILIIHDVKSLDTLAIPITRQIILTHFNHSKIVHNRFSFHELAKEIKASAMGNVHIIPHGNYISLAAAPSGHLNGMPGFAYNKANRYILFFGQLKKAKGLDVLIKAMGRADTMYHLIAAGRGRDDSFASYRDLVKANGLHDRVHVIDRFISDEERDFLFRHSELVVLPYKRVYQSGVLLMSMSYSKVSIASDLEPNREVLNNGQNGFLFDAGNPEPLSRLLEQAYRGQFDLKAIGLKAFETVQTGNSWERIAAAYDAVLQG